MEVNSKVYYMEVWLLAPQHELVLRFALAMALTTAALPAAYLSMLTCARCSAPEAKLSSDQFQP